jgi:hypothetical protein
MKNYMKYFLVMGLVSVASAAVAMGPDEFRVTDSDDMRLSGTYAEPSLDEGDVATPSHWISNPSK